MISDPEPESRNSAQTSEYHLYETAWTLELIPSLTPPCYEPGSTLPSSAARLRRAHGPHALSPALAARGERLPRMFCSKGLSEVFKYKRTYLKLLALSTL